MYTLSSMYIPCLANLVDCGKEVKPFLVMESHRASLTIEGFHDASSDRKSPYWRHSASQQSTGTEVYPERRQGKWLIIAVFQVVPIGQIEKNIWNIIDFQKLLKTRERNARDYQRKGGAWLHLDSVSQ